MLYRCIGGYCRHILFTLTILFSSLVFADTATSATLTLALTVVNDNGGSLLANDFDLSIAGQNVDPQTPYPIEFDTAVLVGRLDLPGYKESNWDCADLATGASNTITVTTVAGNTQFSEITVQQGAQIECRMVSDDQAVDIQLIKAVDASVAIPGQELNYSLEVRNYGFEPAYNLKINDRLDSNLVYISGSISGASQTSDTDPSGAGLLWNLSSLGPNASTTLFFSARVRTN